MSVVAGGCQCGAVRYTIAGARPPVYVCHCRECQKQSASAFGMSLPVAMEHFHVEGRLDSWERDTARGTRLRCFFCPACGSRLYHQAVRTGAGVTVKAGSLDDTGWVTPDAHIWVSRRQSWVSLDPAIPAHASQPDDMEGWRRGFTREGGR